MPDQKKTVITYGDTSIDKLGLSLAAKQQAKDILKSNQESFSKIVTHAFSKSLQSIFFTASIIVGFAAILVFTLKERVLKSAKPTETPGE